MAIIFAIIIFSFLIFIHELGHFLAAKASNVQVNEFAMFMGPAIWKKQVGETRYSIRCIPIGGYCAMEGEDEESEDPRAFTSAKPWKRAIILAAGSSTRMNGGSKQFLCLGGMPVVARTIKEFDVSDCIDEIIVVAKEDEFYLRVKEMLLSEGEVSDAIGRLTDRAYYDSLSYDEKQRYTLSLSEKYLRALERFRAECEFECLADTP